MTKLNIRKLTPTVGAEVEGFDPKANIDAAAWRQLSQALDDHGVLVFRDIALDTPMQHKIVEVLFARGDEAVGAAEAAADAEHATYVSNTKEDGGAPYGRLLYHTDMMWSDIANQVPSLWALEAEQPSTPTTFTSTVHAWTTLPPALKERVKDLRVRHESGQQGRGDSKYEAELLQPRWDKLRETVTPVAATHPRTGQTMLYVCEQQTREIVGLPKGESDALLDALFAHLYAPERIFAHHWRQHDLVVWDNQAVQHGRPNVPGKGPARTLRKIHAPGKIMRQFANGPSYARAAATAG
jgi:alpha-ketoglutarate-dependent taurine dioxygenase